MEQNQNFDADVASDWHQQARCAQPDVDPEIFFPERGGSSKLAKVVCKACNVRTVCLEEAIDQKEQFGIRGGASERERRRIRKERALARA